MEGIDLFVKTLGNGEGRKENFQSLEAPKHSYVTCKWSPTSSWGPVQPNSRVKGEL